MRDDIVGMLKNAIDHGGNPQKIAQSLINSGYPIKDVKEAYDYVVSNNPSLQIQQAQQVNQQTPQIQISSQSQQITQQPTKVEQPVQKVQMSSMQSMPQVPQYKTPSAPLPPPQFVRPKPLPAQKTSPSGNGKIIFLIFILLLLVLSLISVIIFKDDILDLLSL